MKAAIFKFNYQKTVIVKGFLTGLIHKMLLIDTE